MLQKPTMSSAALGVLRFGRVEHEGPLFRVKDSPEVAKRLAWKAATTQEELYGE